MAIDLSGLKNVSDLMKEAPADAGGVAKILVAHIEPDPDQPRKTFRPETIAELAASMQAHGLIQPITVRTTPTGYIIHTGERRWRAAKQLGWVEIDAIVRDDLKARAQLIENIQRENLSAFEIYRSVAAAIDDGTSQKDFAKEVGKSPAWVNVFANVAKMPEAFQEALSTGRAEDITALAQLWKIWKDEPDAALKIATSGAPITRHIVQQLADRLQRQAANGEGGPGPAGGKDGGKDSTSSGSKTKDGVSNSGESLDIGGSKQGVSLGESTGAGAAEPYSPPSRPQGESVTIRVRYEDAIYTVLYSAQRTANGQRQVKLTSESGVTLFAPLEKLLIESIN
ncbi:MAG: ParB/RepB/Spo0J family partition protein [Burkholderiales bacterium]|nr:ParB/RepB/Spo0J family partition protein [Burkholderiales bacterium]